jgi:hypothetical protein
MIRIEIDTANAAFDDQAGAEVARILAVLAKRVVRWPGANTFTLGLRDVNGLKVGQCVVEARKD